MKLKAGVVGETVDNCIRLHTADDTQFPMIDIYARVDEFGNCIDDNSVIEKMAEQICEIEFDL